jgi:uncharacterized protein (DUF3820 family)
MTFGQLVDTQMKSQESLELAIASDFVIPFGKHKGMNLSMLMEEQNGYCQWLLKQEPSKNEKFNETVKYLKMLIIDKEETENPLMTFEGGVIDLGAENKEVTKKLKVDGVELVAGEKAVLKIDPENPEENGIYVSDLSENKPIGNSEDIANGLLMGKLSDLLAQVSLGDLSFEFGEADIDVWFKLCSELDNHGIDAFVVIATKHSKDSNNQRIKKIIPNTKNLKVLKGVIPNA